MDLTKSYYNQNAETMRDKLNEVSSSFCLAKWTQVTLHLQNGHTHSCHHPVPHHIPLDELRQNKYALHNTRFKIEQREQMLNGIKPKECDYCWNIENLGKDHLSDRHFKSGEYWSSEYFDEIVKDPLNSQFLPTYLEVSFSHGCNFNCMYCSPQVSSKWVEDIQKNGSYDLGDFKHNDLSYLQKNNLIPILEREHNPYVEQFWELWPELYKKLRVFRITGGEPLLSKHTWRTLEYIQQNPNPELEILINTNLGVQDSFIDRLIDIGKDLIINNKVKRFEIYTSVESFGEQAEYIRYGLDFDKFINNIIRVTTEIPMVKWKSKVVIMATYNLLSIPKFRKLLEWILEYRLEYSSFEWKNIWLDISYLRYPSWQSTKIVDDKLLETIKNDLIFMQEHNQETFGFNGFQDTEIEKFSRVLSYATNSMSEDQTNDRKRFVKFYDEYDKRKNLDLLTTFPELVDFYNACKLI